LEANHAPRGILNVITGNSEKILENWMSSPLVDDILYFGESDTGIEVGAKIYRAGKKPILELSGSDLMFVWRDAPVNLVAEALLDGFLGSTQICMVPKKALIHEDIFDAFKAEFVLKVRRLKIGLPSEPDILLSPVTKIVKFYECLNDALAKGAKLLCGGERVNHRNIPDKSGIFITPAVLEVEEIEAALTMKCFTEENFFPLIPIIRVKGNAVSEEEKDETIFKKMVSLANGHQYGLRLSAWVISKEYIEKFSEYLHNSGLLRINSRHVGFSMGLASHGGTKKSGGPFGEMNYIWQKTSHLQGISLTHLDPG
jgi:acyl-CoA reductase-like NAD-dependent aldehyde dehydrogenase